MTANTQATTSSDRGVTRLDRTSLHCWFPLIEAAGLPVPHTTLIQMPPEAFRDAFRAYDGEPMDGSLKKFCAQIREAARQHNDFFFLRTGHTSAKHRWDRTCKVRDPRRILDHVLAIIEYSEIASLEGLPCDWWAVRELLPLNPLTFCPNYRDMPVCREFRVFVDDDQVRCWHPYWPLEALKQGGVALPKTVYDSLCNPGDDLPQILELAQRAGAAVGGSWSVDILATGRGWFVTDMAEAARSFHWPACPQGTSKQ